MNIPAWSHSSLKDFEGCARRYQHTRVLKLYPFKETAATRYGNEVHEALEHYVRDGKPLEPMYEKFKPFVDAMLSKPGRPLAEHRMAVTEQLVPCLWDSPGVWVRGIADILIIDDENMTAWVGDWKTGNNRYPDTDQLVLMSLLVFANFPHIRHVKSALFFILKNDMVRMRMSRVDAQKHWQKYRERYARLVASYHNQVWNPTQTPLCGWCPVTGCEFNPKHHGG